MLPIFISTELITLNFFLSHS